MKSGLLHAKSTEILSEHLFIVVREKFRRQKKERQRRVRWFIEMLCVTANSGELHKRNASVWRFQKHRLQY